MSQDQSTKPPREFWLLEAVEYDGTDAPAKKDCPQLFGTAWLIDVGNLEPKVKSIHVIEKSAFTELLAQAKALRDDLIQTRKAGIDDFHSRVCLSSRSCHCKNLEIENDTIKAFDTYLRTHGLAEKGSE